DVSFRVAPGEKVAIVGATGAGKTTIANLLCRFYEFQHGSIRVDGTDIREIAGRALRRQIGLVLQDVFLFSGTVRENIAFGERGRGGDAVERALAEVGGSRLAARLPRGLDEQGTHAELLSKGGIYARLYELQYRRQRVLEPVGEGSGDSP